MQIQLKNHYKRSVVLILIEYECHYRNYIQDLWVSATKPHIDKISFR